MAKNKNSDLLTNENKKHVFANNVSDSGEESASGDAADLESDDDMLENAHDMGLYKGDDGAHPQELNVAAEVQKAEDNRRGLE